MESGRLLMNLKKGLTFVAFGFLFTLVNLNITYNGTAVNILPDFLGWILFFLAFDMLGKYVEDKLYLKWVALILTIVTAVIWIFGIAKPELDIDFLKTAVAVVSMVFMFLLFGSLEEIAHEYGSAREGTLHMLRILNLILNVAFVVLALLAGYVSLENYALLAAFVGTAALVAAIITAFVLFELRKDISDRLPEQEAI